MAVRLNRPGFEHAKRLIGEGSSVRDDREGMLESEGSRLIARAPRARR
jgi:hypothetical protein